MTNRNGVMLFNEKICKFMRKVRNLLMLDDEMDVVGNSWRLEELLHSYPE